MPKLNTITTTTENDNSTGVALSLPEASQPTKLISATTIIPCQNLR